MKLITEVINQIEANKRDLEFLPTGLAVVDEALDGGFLRKELIVLGGSTGVGKSYLSGQIFFNIAHSGFKCGYFSLEISSEMVVSRLLGQIANVKSSRIMTGLLNEGEHKLKVKAKAKLSSYEQFMAFYDNVYLFDQIKEEIKRQKLEFVVIDFIQNVMVPGMDEYQKLSYVALELQKLAKEVNCTIMVLSQLSNMVARDGTGSILEYKGSGSIATVCDLGFFVIRGDYDLEPDKLMLLLRKNRRGISGLSFDFKFRFPGGQIA